MTASFPTSVPTTAQLRGDIGDNVATFLSAGITAVVTTIPVDDTTDFPSAGLASIKKASGTGLIEVFSYTGKTANSFTGATRDFNGKGADSYVENDEVHLYWVADHHNRHVEESIAVAQNIANRFGLATNIVIPNGIGKEFNGTTFLKSPSVGANDILGIKASGGSTVWSLEFTDASGQLKLTPSSTYVFAVDARTLVGSGSTTTPGVSFIAAPGSGMWYDPAGASSLKFSHAALPRLTFDTANGWTFVNTRGLSLPNGTVALPIIYRFDNPDTGIHFPSTSQVAVTINNSNKMIFDSTLITSSVDITMSSKKIKGLAAGSAPGEAVRFEQLLGWKILQVIENAQAGAVSVTTTTFVDTELEISITPASSSNKIMVLFSMPIRCTNAGSGNVFAGIKVLRDAVTIQGYEGGLAGHSIVSVFVENTVTGMILDTPATGSATIYKIQINNQAANGTVRLNPDTVSTTKPATMIVMEVAG